MDKAKEAICFTAGPAGAAFGAGVIHAWLAADRNAPLVAAGISMGAVTAAAMQKCYRELAAVTPEAGKTDIDELKLESARWKWFRTYLETVTNNPLSFLWRAIPDPVDYFADKPPVTDLSVQTLPSDLRDESQKARRHFYLLTKLGTWLAGLPVRVSTAASLVVFYVRIKENPRFLLVNLTGALWHLMKIVTGIWWHIVRSPRFFRDNYGNDEGVRPLFGRRAWGASLFLPFPPLLVICFAAYLLPSRLYWLLPVLMLLLFAAAIGTVVFLGLKFPKVLWFIPKYMFAKLDMAQAFLCQFELRRELYNLFKDDLVGNDGKTNHTLIVCAALEQTKQVWLRPRVPVIKALSAALAIPGVFPPIKVIGEEVENLACKQDATLIDGVSVRNNPIPAFFSWCRKQNYSDITAVLEGSPADPSLHIVYNVPIGADTETTIDREGIDIVESALAALELEKCRDTRQEVRQTNFVSRLEKLRRDSGSKPDGFQIFADEIAPRRQIQFQNDWEPTRAESLSVAAQGCRETLETLYRNEIPPNGILCKSLIFRLATRRKAVEESDACGLPEICSACSGQLSFRQKVDAELPPPGQIRSYGMPGNDPKPNLRLQFPHLNGDTPRIIFLGSGGVFRGAFHIGVVGAMHAARLYPDLVIGASVGALMGGALANISLARETQKLELLNHLASVFLNVDQKVALTRTLKNATKQLGIRARAISISPNELRRLVNNGSQSDAGFAATGAPPALIDAISRLFMIPHLRTIEIASEFIAGHISKAIKAFLSELREETLRNLDIKTALLGTSLLEDVARELLGASNDRVDLSQFQPYHGKTHGPHKVSFFCTTSYLNERMPLLLGRDFLTENPTWDGVFAGLSSSAFPLVFSPRKEAEVLPGRGRTDRLFADGGMFDNLPFMPALEVLRDCQVRGGSPHQASVLNRLARRTKNPDLFIAAGLDAAPADDDAKFETLFKIRSRAGTLSVNSKVESFTNSSLYIQRALSDIVANHAGDHLPIENDDAQLLDGAVNAHVLNILPADADHINPTFAFCRSTGFDKDKVRLSIADGCFQSLFQFQLLSKNKALQNVLQKSIVLSLTANADSDAGASACPWFKSGTAQLSCPFAEKQKPCDDVPEIRTVCGKDPKHKAQIIKAAPLNRESLADR